MDQFIVSIRKAVKYWWISLLVGLLDIVVGIWCLATPISSLVAFTWLFILVLTMSGIFEIIFAISNRSYLSGWGWSIAKGILEILLGVFLLSLPTASVSILLIYIIGFWMLFGSVMGIGASCQLQQAGIKGWGWLLTMSILSLIFSFVYLMSPLFAGIFLIVFVGISFLMYGIFRFILAFKFRQINKELKER